MGKLLGAGMVDLTRRTRKMVRKRSSGLEKKMHLFIFKIDWWKADDLCYPYDAGALHRSRI